jgi:hypothetical protein
LKTLLGTPFFSFPPPRLINDNKALIGVRSILPSHHVAATTNGSAPPPQSSPEAIAREYAALHPDTEEERHG